MNASTTYSFHSLIRSSTDSIICPDAGLCDAQLALDAEFLHPFAQRRACDAQKLRRVHLIAIRFLERLNDEFPLDRRDDLQLGIAPRPLEQLPREGRHLWNSSLAGRGPRRDRRPGGGSTASNFC